MLAHVLAHEIAHIARRDLWFGLLQGWATTLHWPNPLVHLHGLILSRAREELCDNRVLMNVSPADYARTLLALGERLAGVSAATGTALFQRRHTLAARIAGLLDPGRDRAVALGRGRRAGLAALALVLAAASAGVGSQPPPARPAAGDGGQPAPKQAASDVPTPDEVVRRLAARSADWLAPPESLRTLEYDFVSGPRVTPIKVSRGEPRRYGVWTGATLHAGFRALMKEPAKFNIAIEPQAGGKTLRLTARLKEDKGSFRVEVGNGVENSWSGYYSHGTHETTIILDAERFVPLTERTNLTTIRYAGWLESSPGRWVPRRIDVMNSDTHYRMHFDWLGDAVWLLRSSESIAPERTNALSHTRNVRVNGQAVAALPPTTAEARSRKAAAELVAMLDHNRPWLDGGPTGAGWRPSFRTLSYTFHTVREDVREACTLDRGGEAAFEVARDGLGKMKGGLGKRRLALNTKQSAFARRGDRFAHLYSRPERERDQPADLAYKHYARIGCQLDLPLFRYRERLDTAGVDIKDGTWAGRPCRVATVTNLPGVYLGCGTMLAFTSWSYVHHIDPSKEVLYIDPARNVPVHETLVSSRDKQAFEIDFGDYVEVEPGQWAPRSIRIEARDYFTCEYRFRLVAGTHWLLDEVVSWFKPDARSRGVVEDVRVDGSRTLLDESLRQVERTRSLFAGAGEPDRQVEVATVPFVLGQAIRSGPYELRVTMGEKRSVVVSASTNDASAPGTVPLVILDDRHRPRFGASISLAEQGGARRGSVSLRGSSAWQGVRSIAVPVPAGDAPAVRQPVKVVPLRWGEPLDVNIPDARQGEASGYPHIPPRDARTRAWRVRVDRTADGAAARAVLDLVSIDGPAEFELDLTVTLLGADGELVACGQLSTTLKVVSEPVEPRFEIDLGKIRPGSEPRYVAIGIAPGRVLSAPMGSTWGMYLELEGPFDASVLLASPDESCRRAGLEAIDRPAFERNLHSAYMGDWYWFGRGQPDNEPKFRITHLQPHAELLAQIVRTATAVDLKASAARLLAYSEAKQAAAALALLAEDPAPEVREAAAVGLTFLGSNEHLDVLRAILSRPTPENASWISTRPQRDAVTALGHQHSDPAIDLLGETLLADLTALHPVPGANGRTELQGRSSQAKAIASLLGSSGNVRAVRWLTSALDLVSRRPDLAEHFDRNVLPWALIQLEDQTRDRIIAEIENGKAPGAWLNVLSHSDSKGNYARAVRTMLRRPDLPPGTTYQAMNYLRNLTPPDALAALGEMYDRGMLSDNIVGRLNLCEALAARGDGRGLGDAYQVLVDLERAEEPQPTDRENRQQQQPRSDRQRSAEAVFKRASPAILAPFLMAKTATASTEQQRVILRLLWTLPELPEPLAAVIPKWARLPDPQVAELAGRLRDRDNAVD
jgi:hypothetical protein